MKVYLVVFEWSTEDDSDVDIEAFDTYEKATLRFQERINDEKTDMSWVHDAFDENGDILDGARHELGSLCVLEHHEQI